MEVRFGSAIPGEQRCDFSELFISQCAHCQGHEPDWWTPPRKQIPLGAER